ncbi:MULTISPECIES: hypothetical protein [unclassified Methanosarcina]|nr:MULTISPECIES: hypothetical protein [unclassified Methanosarcina]
MKNEAANSLKKIKLDQTMANSKNFRRKERAQTGRKEKGNENSGGS